MRGVSDVQFCRVLCPGSWGEKDDEGEGGFPRASDGNNAPSEWSAYSHPAASRRREVLYSATVSYFAALVPIHTVRQHPALPPRWQAATLPPRPKGPAPTAPKLELTSRSSCTTRQSTRERTNSSPLLSRASFSLSSPEDMRHDACFRFPGSR